MTQLLFSSSPRSTWLWAPDAESAAQVRSYGRPAIHKGEELPLVTDIDIGVCAYETCHELAAKGFTFTWLDTVYELDRGGWPASLPGMPGTTTDPEPRS